MTATEDTAYEADSAALDELPAGARVVIRLPGGHRLADILLGCFDRGLVAVPLHPRAGDADLAAGAARVAAAAVVDVHGVRRIGLPDAHPTPEAPALIMFTSGSTGPQKGVVLSRRAVIGNARRTAVLYGITPDRPHGTCLPLYHCNALVMSLLGTHLTGTPLTLHPAFDPAGYFAALDASGARTASIVPALLADLVEAAPAWPDGLDYLITAAAPLTADLAHRFHSRYGPRLRQGYGLTEAVNFSFTMPLLDDTDFRAHYLERTPPVGVPLPGTELHLESGEVWIRTPDLMTGYWQDPRTTAATVTDDGWLRTGDLGELRDGLLVLRGRAGERINRGGEKHHPLDIEHGWRRAGLTGRFAAVAVDEPTLGDDVALVATEQPVPEVRTLYGRSPLRPAVVQFGGYRATATGKPQRRAMSRPLAARRLAPARYDRLLRHAAATARHLLDSGTDDPALRSLAEHNAARHTGIGDDTVLAAYDFLREHWHAPVDAELTRAKAEWRAKLLAAWPLSAHRELAVELAARHGVEEGPVPWGVGTRLDGGALVLLPHGPAPGGSAWPLGPLLSFLDVPGSGGTDRWEWLSRQRDGGTSLTGCSVLRAGRHDAGGVLWARHPGTGRHEHTGATG